MTLVGHGVKTNFKENFRRLSKKEYFPRNSFLLSAISILTFLKNFRIEKETIFQLLQHLYEKPRMNDFILEIFQSSLISSIIVAVAWSGFKCFFSRKNYDWKIFWINFNNLKFSNPLSFRQTLLYWVGLCYLYSYLQFLQFCPILEKWEKSKIFKRNRNFTQKYFIMNEDKRTWRNQGSKSLLGYFPSLKKLFIQNITLNFKIN